MKKHVFGMMLPVLMFIISGCASTAPRYMSFKEGPAPDLRSVKPDSGKAALVVARTTKLGGLIEFDTYLDKKMIGVTQWKSYFIKTDVAPGTHYVISRAERMEPVKIDFEPGRVYYVHQSPRMGVWRARVSIALETPEQVLATFDGGCRYIVCDPQQAGPDLSDEDFNQSVADYARLMQEGRHKNYEGYRGVAAK